MSLHSLALTLPVSSQETVSWPSGQRGLLSPTCGCLCDPISVSPPDPPVHILDPREHVFVHAITSECVMLTCEVDREGAPVHWYKDGQEVEESDFVVLENEGAHHRLVLPAAQPPDGGEFQCVAGDERAYFTVTITGGVLGGLRAGKVSPALALRNCPCFLPPS